VPLLQDLVQSEQDRQIATAVSLPTTVGPGYWMAPGVPEEALRIVRKAFDMMMADPQLLADARRIKLDIVPKSGERVQTAVNAVAHFPQNVLARTGTILKW
jgi:tripartite-type tricarboxylate transporter receptor subunit TctC